MVMAALERETPLSSSNKFRFLFFCAVKGDDTPNNYSFNWYSIDFREDRNSSSLASTVCPRPDCGTILSSVFSNMPRNVPRYFVSVALGTRIYLIGGRTGQGRKASIHSDVFYFDVVHPEQGWKEGPSMIMARFKPSAVVLDSKIYVFGGVESTGMLYAEVLNPVSDKWEPLPQPTFLLSNFVAPVHALLSDDKKERRLLFQPFDRDALFSYNLDTGSWEIFDECFGRNCYNETSVAVDGVLYCYFYPNVYAYDLLKQKWFSKPVRGLPREDMHPPYHYTVFFISYRW
ncbi:F-box/kelch-repeat protein At4g19330-like [Cornus florida]|uniref:F-box/kelch-repeat protein At4g19330-like n=1 Tax=Cornus florida TaxID=4283 RepID=UPI00289BC13C|nr:F-box/kelch-repeat protein At4g19330-like [Cornus florida]XP_059649006.1 F-box/kelch-repeat protein At4g19330-like [Cornus florida]XP_059649007.1 F-box/kelch-repeat protein At4g19330-like [Cornus florida]XP_059649008.1 F-box/kelch-repeat protein At4g19330-like [Cornus florida]XP_059649009.1 F-box/kelch-repeat protein At4g19330-like [Cornus florida]XP_059649010.1 F-box/kelch-repeat protein At4g19330-like [Cornus florida]